MRGGRQASAAVARGHRHPLGQVAEDAPLFGEQLGVRHLEVVVEVDHLERLDEHRLPAARGVVHDAQPGPLRRRLHGHDVAVVAHRGEVVLKGAAVAVVTAEAVERIADAGVEARLAAAEVAELGVGRDAQLAAGIERPDQPGGEVGLGVDAVRDMKQAGGDVVAVAELAVEAGQAFQGVGERDELAAVEDLALLGRIEQHPDVRDAPQAGRPPRRDERHPLAHFDEGGAGGDDVVEEGEIDADLLPHGGRCALRQRLQDPVPVERLDRPFLNVGALRRGWRGFGHRHGSSRSAAAEAHRVRRRG